MKGIKEVNNDSTTWPLPVMETKPKR